jgi:hypothetical protein
MPAPFFDDAAKMWDLGPVLLRTPQACFEYSRGEIIGLPSRLSALPDAQISRQKALDDVARDGITFGYRRLRVGKSGRQFWIEDCTIWQLEHDAFRLKRSARPVYGEGAGRRGGPRP